jgi:hypothetical protein
MNNKVRFNDNVEVYIYDNNDDYIDVNKTIALKNDNIYDKYTKYLLVVMLFMLIIYLFV